jgi:hypothetical protein
VCPASGCGAGLMHAERSGLPSARVKRRRLTPERARQLVTDFKQTIRELRVDLRRAVDLGLELSIYAYDAYILEGARSSGSVTSNVVRGGGHGSNFSIARARSPEAAGIADPFAAVS